MNARKIWTELFQKPAGRLVLFLLVGGIFLAFILTRRGPQPKPDNTPVAGRATLAKSYSFREDIQPLTRTQATPSPREPDDVARATHTPKPPPPIPQTIFATKEHSVSDCFLPYGRLLRCELVNTVDSSNIDTPIIGLIIEDAWNDGRVIIPAGTEVHGVAQKSPVRERIGAGWQWFLVFQDGRELPISGTVLDHAPKNPDSWAESDGSAGLRGFVMKSDKYAEAKAILAAMISAGAGAFSETTTLISPLGGSTRTLFTSAFLRAPRSTSTSRKRSIWPKPQSVFPLPFHRQTTGLINEILPRHYPALSSLRLRHAERSPFAFASGGLRHHDCGGRHSGDSHAGNREGLSSGAATPIQISQTKCTNGIRSTAVSRVQTGITAPRGLIPFPLAPSLLSLIRRSPTTRRRTPIGSMHNKKPTPRLCSSRTA